MLYGVRTTSKLVDGNNTKTDKNITLLHGLDSDVVTKKATFQDKIIIGENNKYKAIFDILMLLLVGYSCVVSMF